MADTFYAYDKDDAPDARRMLDAFRTRSRSDDLPDSDPSGVRAILIVKPPEGSDAGKCLPLMRDAEFPYIWEVSVIGYPGFENFETVEVKIDGEAFSFDWDALPGEVIGNVPERWKTKTRVSGGTVHDDSDDSFTPTGRFYFAFSVRPGTFAVTDTNSEIVVLSAREVVFRPFPVLRDFWTIVDVTVPSPINAGALAYAADVAGIGLSVLSVEPRSFRPLGGSS